jgi:hypothetical protein
MAINKVIHDIFISAFENKCFYLITKAYEDAIISKVIQLNWNENDISYELHSIIKNNPLRVQWMVSINVEAYLPKNVTKMKGFSGKLPRIDFRMSSFNADVEYEYFFEAKNLKHNDSALKRRYINTGIDNFLSGKYYNGSLIGYVLNGNTDKIVKDINSLLIKDNRNTELLYLKKHKIAKNYYESNHIAIGTLKHLFFDFANF